MARPVIPKPPTEHLLVIARMLQSVDVDESIESRSKVRIRAKLGELMGEFQKLAVTPGTPVES